MRVWYLPPNVLQAASLTCSCLLLAACGGSDVDHAYRRIQLAEARLSHAAAAARGDCEAVCEAAGSIAREADALPGDGDAAARAARASEQCRACRGKRR